MDDRVVGKLNESGVFRVDSSTSGAVKRSRTASSGIQGASCLVDGCNSDLSKCRDYHRRHKVCELHSKTPKVTVKGQEQRFCQQCSRFHSLEEFDEGKRSCRKRLDGHNRRRRKPQPETLAMNSGTFLAEYEGARFLAFDHGQVLPRVPVLSSAWAENGYVPFNSQSQLKFDGRNGSIRESLCEQGERQFSFVQGTKSTLDGYAASAWELNLDTDLTSANAGSSQKAFSKGLNRVFDSDCALSLLSSTPAETREVGLRHIMQPNAISPAGSFIPLDGLGMVGDNTNTNTNTNLNCQGMFHFGSDDGSSSSLAHQKLFSWE